MQPTSLSATAIKCFEECEAMFKAQYVDRVREASGSAADLGTAVHDTCETWVKNVQAGFAADLESLISDFDRRAVQYGLDATMTADGRKMLKDFHRRWVEMPPHEVVSTELKESFQIKSSCGQTVQVNYIWDRGDRHPDASIEVVDYKGLATDTPIPTPAGWTTMEKLEAGDEVIGGDGRPCRVAHKSEIHMRPCYEIEFDDGSSIVCDDEHRWEVEVTDSGGRWLSPTVWTAKDLAEHGPFVGKQRGIRIATVSLDLPEANLPIDPYVFGAWIGDGTEAQGSISKPLEALWDEIRSRGYEVGDPYNDSDTRTVYGLRTQLRLLGVLGNKRIPDEYLRSSRSQRLELLRGIMDTDGHMNIARKRAVLNTTSREYAKQVYELVVSLGWTANIFATRAEGFGRTWDAWQLWFTPTGEDVFLARKPDVVPKSKRTFRRIIKSITPVPTVATQCIEVDSPDSCFLAGEQMVKTHNTWRKVVDADEMRRLTQVRLYALSAAIKFKAAEPPAIWVTYDQMRTGPVSVKFTKEDNRLTWNYLRDVFDRIIASDGTRETVGDGCRYCVRKADCRTLHAAMSAGNIQKLRMNPELAATRLAELKAAKNATDALVSELEEFMSELLEEHQVPELSFDNGVVVKMTVRKNRKPEMERISKLLGPELMARYGKLGLTELDEILAGDDLDDDTKAQVRRHIRTTVSGKATASFPKR